MGWTTEIYPVHKRNLIVQKEAHLIPVSIVASWAIFGALAAGNSGPGPYDISGLLYVLYGPCAWLEGYRMYSIKCHLRSSDKN